MKVYSKLDTIPGGRAGDSLICACLVLEGGAFRGLYTQGFLDAMMVHGLDLSCVIGVSAGALSAISYVSGQIGRSGRINLTYRRDSRYVGLRAFLKSRSILDVSFLTEERGIFEPMDEERFSRPGQRMIAVTTNVTSGETSYFEKGKCADILEAVRASATMPYISPPVRLDGEPHLDGGCSCKIPYEWALGEGYEKILVIRTREKEFRKPEKKSGAPFRFYGKYPAFAKKLSESNIDYNAQCDEVESLNESGRLMRIAPSETVTVSRLEKDMEKLGALYWLGYNDCESRLDEIKAYLGL